MVFAPKKIALAIAVLSLAAVSTTAFAETRALWKAAMYGRSTDDSLSTSRTVGFGGFVYLEQIFTPDFEARVLGGVLLETGSSSSLFTNEFEPKSRLVLQEASLRWRFARPFTVMAGALDQSHHKSPLLVDGGTFPAALISFDPGFGKWIVHFDTQAAIPMSRTFSTRSTTGKEDTPMLFTEKFVSGWQDKSTGLKILGRVSHFDFRNLTRGMAQDSRFYGNQITGIGAASQFVYQYEGFEAGPEINIPLASNVQWGIGGSYLQNRQGPRGNNQGYYAFSDITFIAEKFALRPRIEYYRNEADSSPAFYSSADFGHNNRAGMGAGLRLILPKPALEIELKGRRGELITPQTFQKDRFDYLELVVEIPYAGF